MLVGSVSSGIHRTDATVIDSTASRTSLSPPARRSANYATLQILPLPSRVSPDTELSPDVLGE